MSETRKRFNANNEVKESFMLGIKKATGIISVIKEEVDIRNKLHELQRKDSEITEQIKGLKISLKLVNKEEIKKALEEIISLKEKDLENVDNESDRLNSQLSECTAELEEYEDFISYLYQTDLTYDFINVNNMDFEQVSRNEFIACLFVWSNFGDDNFPKFNKKKMPEILHEAIDATEDANENGWDSFIKWIEEN